jgi:hypothetical protein
MIIMYSLTVRRLRKVLKEFQCKSDNKNHVHLSFRPRVDKVKKRFAIVSFFSPRNKSKKSIEQSTNEVVNGKQQTIGNWHSAENQDGKQQQEPEQAELKQQRCANENEETECLMSHSNPETTKQTEITITEANKDLVDGQLETHVDNVQTPQAVKAPTAFKGQVGVLKEDPRSCLKLSNKVLSKSEQIQPVSSACNNEMNQMANCNHTNFKAVHLVFRIWACSA